MLVKIHRRQLRFKGRQKKTNLFTNIKREYAYVMCSKILHIYAETISYISGYWLIFSIRAIELTSIVCRLCLASHSRSHISNLHTQN